MKDAVERLRQLGKEISLLSHTLSLLGWDQETCMPPGGAEGRAEQSGFLEGLLHDRLAGDEMGTLLDSLGADDDHPEGSPDLDDQTRAVIKVLYRDFSRQRKIPRRLVVDLARESAAAFNTWVEARHNDDFSLFQPRLERILDLVREKAEKIGYADHPYDALLDEFEPDATTEELRSVFATLRTGLQELVSEIGKVAQVEDSFLHEHFPVEKQDIFTRKVLTDLGYDFNRGRQDLAPHPFTTTLGFDDVRITTRYDENYFGSGIFSSIHECGHALYEMGFADSLKDTLLADGTSLGIHESQSRMWENMIGRSFEFWDYYLPALRDLFPGPLKRVDTKTFFRGINRVDPSLIRVEADEITYNLHIIIRFELELELVEGTLSVAGLPAAWNRKYQELLGVTPESDRDGCLQDVHWSHGAIGYFPTYSLGNMYAAQFYRAMEESIGPVGGKVGAGQFSVILSWLRDAIHSHGSALSARQLCDRITGESLRPDYFLSYIRGKAESVYGL